MPIDDAPPPYRGVVFDCDSTLATIEGVDELAPAGSDVRARIEAMTRAAMGGATPLAEVYGQRLELLRPSRAALDELGRAYVASLVPGVRALVATLRRLDKHVAIVSGGLRPAVLAVAAELGIAPEDVHAVDVDFDAGGAYRDFERDSPLARSGGKLDVARRIAARHAPLAWVGDGVTDLEAAPAAARVIAYGGVVRRPDVFSRARVGFEELDVSGLLPLLLDANELARA